MDVDAGESSGFPYWTSVSRKFEPDSAFFASGNIERELLAKQVALDISEEEKGTLPHLEHQNDRVLYCPIVGCKTQLKSLEDFDNHYNAHHCAVCSVCSRVYPMSRLLNIHLSEAHDSFFQAKVARGFAMYECLVEGCNMKFKSYKSRKQHLVDLHKFPTSFHFSPSSSSHPSKKQRARKQRQQKKHAEADRITDLSAALSTLSTAEDPLLSVRFGRHHPLSLPFYPRNTRRS